jgi:chloramphenicol O-acetyltransferase type A
MPQPIDLTRWPRRHTHAHFRGYAHPWFSVCVMLDAAPLKAALQGRGGFALACHWAALAAMRPIDAFHLRLASAAEGGGVLRVDELHAGTTVASAHDEAFRFAMLRWADSHAGFARRGRAAFAAAAADQPAPEPQPEARELVHCTTLPWLHFTSFTHARDLDSGADNPKLAFGQLRADGPHAWLPLAVDVHHALVDGVHVGRFVQGLQALLHEPEGWLDR